MFFVWSSCCELISAGLDLKTQSRKSMQSCCIRQHARGTVHKIATNLFLEPDRPVVELLPYNLDDQSLWRGSVPQQADWLRAWSSCRTASSFFQAERYYQTEDFAHGRRCSVSRKSSLMLIMLFYFESQRITHTMSFCG